MYSCFQVTVFISSEMGSVGEMICVFQCRVSRQRDQLCSDFYLGSPHVLLHFSWSFWNRKFKFLL